MTTYTHQWLLVIVSTLILAFGVSMEVAANISMMPGELLVKIIAAHTKTDFGIIKVYFDITLITISIIISLYFFGYLNSVREGTIFTAISTEFMSDFSTKSMIKLVLLNGCTSKNCPLIIQKENII